MEQIADLRGSGGQMIWRSSLKFIVYSVPITGGTPTTLTSLNKNLVEGGLIINGGTGYGTTTGGGANGMGTGVSGIPA